jgi:hypothetical protein
MYSQLDNYIDCCSLYQCNSWCIYQYVFFIYFWSRLRLFVLFLLILFFLVTFIRCNR